MARARRATRGYFLPFAVAIVFAVMTVASALVVAVGGYRKLAATQERELLDRMALESAVELAADRLLAGEGPPDAPIPIAGREVTVEISSPATKVDVNADPPERVAEALAEAGVKPRPALAGPDKTLRRRFQDFASAARLTPAEGDCARRRLTAGRWPAPLIPLTSAETAWAEPSPGEQVDVRAAFADERVGRKLLWARLRFTGGEAVRWTAHEWRLLARVGGDVCGSEAREHR